MSPPAIPRRIQFDVSTKVFETVQGWARKAGYKTDQFALFLFDRGYAEKVKGLADQSGDVSVVLDPAIERVHEELNQVRQDLEITHGEKLALQREILALKKDLADKTLAHQFAVESLADAQRAISDLETSLDEAKKGATRRNKAPRDAEGDRNEILAEELHALVQDNRAAALANDALTQQLAISDAEIAKLKSRPPEVVTKFVNVLDLTKTIVIAKATGLLSTADIADKVGLSETFICKVLASWEDFEPRISVAAE